MNLLRKKQTVKVEDRLLAAYEDAFEQAVECIRLQSDHRYTEALASWSKLYAGISDCYQFLRDVNKSDSQFVRTHEQYTLLNRIQEIEKRCVSEISYLDNLLEQQKRDNGVLGFDNLHLGGDGDNNININDEDYYDDYRNSTDDWQQHAAPLRPPSVPQHGRRGSQGSQGSQGSSSYSNPNAKPMLKTLRGPKPPKYQPTSGQTATSMTAATLAWPGRSNSATSTSSIGSDLGVSSSSNGRAVSPTKSNNSNGTSSRTSSFGNNVSTSIEKFSLRGPAQGFNKYSGGSKVARKPVTSSGSNVGSSGGPSGGSNNGSLAPDIPVASPGTIYGTSSTSVDSTPTSNVNSNSSSVPSIVLRPAEAKSRNNSYNNSPPKPRPALPSPKPSSLRPAKITSKTATSTTTSKTAATNATSGVMTSAHVLNASIAASNKKRQMAYASEAAKAGATGRPLTVTANTTSTSNEPEVEDADEANMTEFDKRMDRAIKNLRGVDKAAAKQVANEIVEKGDEVHWDDIAGLEQAKASLKEAVVYPFLRPDLFSGLREPARGMLLFGPPGTGKTMLARAVATESKSTFFSISASSLTSKYLGESEKLVRALFEMSKALAPSIIFVDEIDSLLSQRSDSGEHEASRRIKNEFLIQWSALQSAAAGSKKDEEDVERVLVLAATNLPWAIDEAARRRFVRRQYIPLPERETRLQHLKKLMQNQTHALSDKDYETILGLTDGFSGSDITALAKDAAMGPLRSLGEALLTTPRDQIRPIGVEDFLASLKTIRPSVSKTGLKDYEEWAKLYGSSGA